MTFHLYAVVFALLSLRFQREVRAAQSSGYDYNGGVAMRYPNTSCPHGTFYEGTSYEANCCPDGQYPSPGGSAYCCPSKGKTPT